MKLVIDILSVLFDLFENDLCQKNVATFREKFDEFYEL